MITKKYIYKGLLATINGSQTIVFYTRNAKEYNIFYDYGTYIKHIKYKNPNEAVEDFYNKIRFLHKYGNEVQLTLDGAQFIKKGGII